MQSITHPRGMILFLTVLILGVTATTVVLMLSQTSLSGLLSIDEQSHAVQVRSELFGCVDETLIHLSTNPAYNPGIVDFGTYTCTASVVVNGSQRAVTLTRVDQGITQRAVVTVDTSVSPIAVLSVSEQ